MTTKFTLLAGIALAGLAAMPAAAQQQVAAADTTASAADATPPAAEDAPAQDIVVLGFGRSRQVQEVTHADIARLVPGASPLKAIEKLPGVNFQAADPFGNYEWAVRISLRGFNQNQLGFTLDDVPLGDMSYGNVNGLHISRAIISENVARTEVAQGAGAVGTASTSNLGGTIQFYSDAPTDKAGIRASGTYGADSMYRGYARIDSGEIGSTGLKGYLSYVYYKTDKWKGYGDQRQHQVNAKLVEDLGDLGSITAFFNFSDRRETDYQDLSYDIIARRGYKIDNFGKSSLYGYANQLAHDYENGTPLPGNITLDDQYFGAGGLRQDYLGGLTFDAHLTPQLTFKTTGYYHANKGQGSWLEPYDVTPAGALNQDGSVIANPGPQSFRTTEYAISRGGAVSKLSWEHGPNTLALGGWLESNTFDQARRYYGLADGDTPNRDALDFQKNPYRTRWDGHYQTDTYQYHVEDTLKLLDDRLVVNAGWKGVYVVNSANMRVVGGLASGKINARDWFQPQAGILFKATPGLELFADYTENMRAFVSSATTGPFATTQAGFDAIRSQLKPETSQTYEGGARFRHGPFQASAVGYYVNFDNRLLSFSNGAGVLGNPPTLNNVGSVHTYGAEVTANYRILTPLSLFASYSFTHSKYADNVVDANNKVLFATDGKFAVDTPEHMVKGEVVYDDGQFMGRVGADYMSKRYVTYLNDIDAKGRVLVDASVGYTFRGDGFLHGFGIVANVTNLTNKKYISTIGTNGFVASGDYQTLMVGTPREWFLTLKKDL